MALQAISKLISLKPEPQTTPSLSPYIQQDKAKECVSEYYLTPSLRTHFKRVFERVVHRQGQGFWVQAEYGAGKTHFLATLVNLLMWQELGVWNCLRDEETKKEYEGALSKVKMFPVAFSLRGMGESNDKDSLMRIFEDQIRESLIQQDSELAKQVTLTSAEIADAWYANDPGAPLRAAVLTFFQQEHKCTPEEFRAKHGAKKFGQELVRSTIPDGRLKGKFKERFAHIYDQITKLGKYDGIIFVVDEFRSWQDRHLPGTVPFAADIKEGKNDPIYNAHSYHTKVPPRSIVPYILHYTQPGDLVLDMFCGSGMTGVAAQMCATPPADILESFPELRDSVGPRACVLNDLSPAACHIAYNYNTPVDIEAFKSEFERIKETTRGHFDRLYGAEHYEPAVGRYEATNGDVACRLKNRPSKGSLHTMFGDEERTWELLTMTEVEKRLGFSVTELPRDEKWKDLDLTTVKEWVCIPSSVQYTIWSDVYRCEGFAKIEELTGKISKRGKNAGKPIMRKQSVARGCGKDIVHWEVAVDPQTEEVSEDFKCPHCQQPWQKLSLELKETVPICSAYEFLNIRGKVQRVRRRFTSRELSFLSSLQITKDMRDFELDPKRELMTMGPNKRGVKRFADFFTPRNFIALNALLQSIQVTADIRTRGALFFAFTSIISYCCRKQNYGGGGGGMSGTLYIPSFHQEKNVWEVFERKVNKLFEAFTGVGQSGRCEIICNDARKLPLSDEIVDYIFVDPPFGGNIYYADASVLWEGWLNSFTDETKELVFNRQRYQDENFKTLDDYESGMHASFAEMFRVLKPGRWCTVEFNNSDGKVFEAIKRAVESAGFEIANMLLLDKTQKSFKQVKGASGDEDVVDKDVLFNLHKPSLLRTESLSEDHDLERQLADAVRDHLQSLPERIRTDPDKYNDEHRTTATINSMLMNTLIPRGVSVDRLNLPFIERVCARYFRKVGQRWYLRGESIGATNGHVLIEEEVSVKDELTAIAWLRQKIDQKAMLVGELKPLWMRATGLLPASVSQDLSLDNLLSENFWRDADSNRWREPTDEEREKMNDDRSIRVLHDADRFIAGTLHRTTSDGERCEWIDVLFKACRQVEDGDMQSAPALRGFDVGEAYRVITRLFQSVLREKVSTDAYTRAQKQATVATNRIAQSVREAEELQMSERSRLKGPTLFDGVD